MLGRDGFVGQIIRYVSIGERGAVRRQEGGCGGNPSRKQQRKKRKELTAD